MNKKWEPWVEVRELVGCPHQKAVAIVNAARKALPYPQTSSTEYINVQYGADKALLAGLRTLFRR